MTDNPDAANTAIIRIKILLMLAITAIGYNSYYLVKENLMVPEKEQPVKKI
jgi:hypothetical protein